MNDFRIEVFLSVARNLSFTKASNELFISQPAISKHISELENIYNTQLFSRANNKISLTKAGEVFYKYAEEIYFKYRELQQEINDLTDNNNGKLRIGASTTIAQYILPAIIARYKQRYADIEISLLTGNTEYIETLISNKTIDLGIVEGAKHKKNFKYSLFTRDELVLITSSANKYKDEISALELKELPLIIREEGSGTLEVTKKALEKHNIKLADLNIAIRLGSSEAIKRYIMAGEAYAIMSINAVMDELRGNKLSVVEIQNTNLNRDFSFITNSGSHDKAVDKFITFCTNYYNNKL